MKNVLALALVALGGGGGARPEKMGAETATTGLTVCRMVSPANIVSPVFGWKMVSRREGAAQKAYRV